MLEKIYFWKVRRGYSTPIVASAVIVCVLVMLAGGAWAWWYYGIKVPADKKHLAHQQALRKQQADLAAITSFYKKSLSGADITQVINVLGEIRYNTVALSALGIAIENRNFVCDTKSCALGFKIQSNAILILPVIAFFGKNYAASVPVRREEDRAPINDFEYTRLALPLAENKLLNQWRSKKTLSLYSCNEIISYINSYNSLLNIAKRDKAQRDGMIFFKSYPSSSVKDKEKQLAGHLKFRGLMSANWEMQVSDDSAFFFSRAPEINAQVALYKQAYRDAFLIKKVESNDKGIKISGGLVCKA